MAKMLSLRGLYIINEIANTLSETSGRIVTVLKVTDSSTKRTREFRFDGGSIARQPEFAKKTIEHFIRTGKILEGSKLSHYPTPHGYSQSLTIASFNNIINQPCLVRYLYAGQKIGMLFYPHQVSF